MFENLLRMATRVQNLPLLSLVTDRPNRIPSPETLEGFRECQRLAQASVKEVASLIQPGWTEIQAAQMVETFLRDSGVKVFFHKPYAWFGERTRFSDIHGYADFMPTERVLRIGEPFLLDVAPIFKGFVADIGYSDCLGECPGFDEMIHFLKEVRERIPVEFSSGKSGGEICRSLEETIEARGYENRHRCYPFQVLGHRVYRLSTPAIEWNFLNFGWQSFWSLLSRGLLGQLFNQMTEGDLTGLWAIEPHIGLPGGFGAKFEEILVVEGYTAYWLEEIGCFCKKV